MARPVQAPFSLFLALRYLRPKRTFVSVITIISVLGVTLGIAVLIVVISVMTGFDRSLQKAILGFEPHIRVVTNGDLKHWREILPLVEKVPGVVGVAPYVQGPVLVEGDHLVNPAVVRGIDIDQERRLISNLDKYVIGSTELSSDTVILGRVLAGQLGVGIGDEITIYAPGNVRALIDEIRKDSDSPDAKPRTLADIKSDIVIPGSLKVVGLINTHTNSFDANFMLVPLNIGQELYSLRDSVHGLAVKTSDPYKVQETQRLIDKAIGDLGFATTWIEENSDRFDAIRMEKHVMFVILFFIVIVAAFGIMNTLITVTVQKTREIGVMKALGARTSQIVSVFLAQGMCVGAGGTITGLVLGLTILHFRNPFRDWLGRQMGIQIFPSSIYEFDGIPAEVVPRDVAIICIGAFLICSLAALVPAYVAARLDPVKALRVE